MLIFPRHIYGNSSSTTNFFFSPYGRSVIARNAFSQSSNSDRYFLAGMSSRSRCCENFASCARSVVCVHEKNTCGLPLQNSRRISVFPTLRLPYNTISCPCGSEYFEFKKSSSAFLPINKTPPPLMIPNLDLLNRDLNIV